MRGVVTAVLVAVVAFGWLVPLAMGAANWEGVFVQGPDGTVWVVAGGSRYRIAAVPMTADDLGRIPEAASVYSLAQLPGGQAAAAPEATGTEPAPAPAEAVPAQPAAEPATPPAGVSPVQSLTGQTLETTSSYNGQRLRYEIRGAVWVDATSGGSAKTKYLGIVVRVTNLGSATTRVGTYGDLGLMDETGRVFPMLGDSDQKRISANGGTFNSASPFTSLQSPLVPGQVATMAIVFGPVPIDVQSLRFVRI